MITHERYDFLQTFSNYATSILSNVICRNLESNLFTEVPVDAIRVLPDFSKV